MRSSSILRIGPQVGSKLNKETTMNNYTAIVSRNLRDVATGAPKVLLRDIQCEGVPYRDHAWVEITNELEQLVSSIRGNKSVTITFSAKEKVYMYRGEVFKKTLKRVKDISIVRRRQA